MTGEDLDILAKTLLINIRIFMNTDAGGTFVIPGAGDAPGNLPEICLVFTGGHYNSTTRLGIGREQPGQSPAARSAGVGETGKGPQEKRGQQKEKDRAR
ncbi:unnamed protein product, partial [Amoebophrya sp. A25]|eukprot:GSA25T00027243001.1